MSSPNAALTSILLAIQEDTIVKKKLVRSLTTFDCHCDLACRLFQRHILKRMSIEIDERISREKKTQSSPLQRGGFSLGGFFLFGGSESKGL